MLTLQTGSRLHFGLSAFGDTSAQPRRRLFGGVGVMIDGPNLELQMETAERFEIDESVRDDLAPRLRRVTESWLRYHLQSDSPIVEGECIDELPIRIRCTAIPPAHCGFGSGTQLALATVALLQRFHQAEPLAFADAISVSGRGRRSTVGSYGFFKGGLIVDRGRYRDEPVSALQCHERIPDEWRFVVLCPRERTGLHGTQEVQAFRDVPPVPPATTRKLQDEIHEQMLPAIRSADFDRFAHSVWRYGSLAGSCFASVQGGCFNGPTVTRLVDAIRSHGVTGVGQSSWGPGVFAVVPDPSAAKDLLSRLNDETMKVVAVDSKPIRSAHLDESRREEIVERGQDKIEFEAWLCPPRNVGHSLVTPDMTLHRPA